MFCLPIIFMPTWVIIFTNEEVKFFSIKVVVIPSIDVSFVILTTYALSDREYFKRNNISACDGHWELVVSDTLLISFLISAPTILPINYLYHLDFSKIATQLGNFFDCCLEPALTNRKRLYCISQYVSGIILSSVALYYLYWFRVARQRPVRHSISSI